MVRAMLLMLLAAGIAPAAALEPFTENTYRLADGEAPANVALDDVAWLAGNWRGGAFGKTFEAVWNLPSAGSMVGLFKLVDGDQVDFYELLTIAEIDGRLGLRVKHFARDFTAWEEKDDFVFFELLGSEPDAAHFSGISFYRRSSECMDAFIVFRRTDGVSEEKLTYRRVR